MNLTRVGNVLKTTTVFFFIFLNITVFSQNQSNPSSLKKDLDTLKSANEILAVSKDYISKKEYNKAVLFLSNHYDKFSENLYINWLYAYALSMDNNNSEANNKFKKAISIDATNKDLQLDYARFLYKIGKINKVETILSNFLDENSKNVEFLMMQANINFWKGDLKNARSIITKINKIYPNTNYTKNLESEIESVTATYIKANFEYQTDSQPLDYFASHITIGEYISRYLSPQLEVSRYSFSPENEDALTIQLKNQFNSRNIIENEPGGQFTAYSVNKGEQLALCLRDAQTDEFIELNLVLFVAIHELAHIMTDEIGHPPIFWENMKYLLEQGEQLGIYIPEDYSKHKKMYCGQEINSTPYQFT